MDNMTKALINRMARASKVLLTPKHLEILEFAHAYYKRYGVGPMYRNIEYNTGAVKKDLDELFPNGINSVYFWTGIPVYSPGVGCKPYAVVEAPDFREIYMDYNASTPIRREVADLISEYAFSPLSAGNPSSATNFGRKSFDMVQKARERIAGCLKVREKNVVFTGSGSEAINLAIKGLALSRWEKKGHIVTGKIEHHAVLHAVEHLEKHGFTATFVEPDKEGFIRPEAVENAIRPDTFLVSVMWANNEIGTINDINSIGAVCRRAGVVFMSDAVQAFGKIPVYPEESGVSLLCIAGHKIYAPKGVGALYVSPGINLTPLVHGGGQEFGLRGGTENVMGIAAFGLAAKLACEEKNDEALRLNKIKDYFLTRLKEIEPGFILNGSKEKRLPNNLNVGIPGIDGGSLLLSLNRIGVYVSAGSACSSGNSKGSHVLQAIGTDTAEYAVIRFSFGLGTSVNDVDYLFKYLPEIISKLREA